MVTIDLDTEFDDWDIVSVQIADLLDAAGLVSVVVEIGRGKVSRRNGDLLPSESWTAPARFGGSIKARDESIGSGTFGGTIRLTWVNGVKQNFGLTCFHCVISQKSSDATKREWAQRGLRPEDEHDIVIDMPSPIDHARSIKTLESNIAYLETEDYKKLVRIMDDPELSEHLPRS